MTAAGNEPLRSESHLTGWLKHGLIGGIVAGIVFAAFEMVIAAILYGPSAFFMPLRMIGGIAIGQQALDPGTSLLAAGSAGLVVHMVVGCLRHRHRRRGSVRTGTRLFGHDPHRLDQPGRLRAMARELLCHRADRRLDLVPGGHERGGAVRGAHVLLRDSAGRVPERDRTPRITA